MSHNSAINVTVGLSGGVDSAVSALLLKEQGYNVSAIFMRNWEPKSDDPYCTLDEDLSDAKAVCKKLDIQLEVVNFAREYWQRVFQYFLDEYNAGRTPNPDILCNKEIKFKAFLEYAIQNGAHYIATGHYARNDLVNGQYLLKKACDLNKDQTYFLYTLNQNALKHSLFPIGHLQKGEVRKIAKDFGFLNFAKKDSTGICFIGERKFKKFLSEYLLAKPGNIITDKNQIIGKHDGLMFYTLGQRQGLNIGGVKSMVEAPWYVIKKDLEKNNLIVAQDSNHPFLMSKTLHCKDLHWVIGNPPMDNFSATAKIRYRQNDVECEVTKINHDLWQVDFAVSQHAITPGQSVVFYQADNCLGGGVII